MKHELTAARLRELLHYDPEAGIFIRRVNASPRWRAGTKTGAFDKGYVQILLGGIKYKAHRLAWLYVHGEWPEGQIDHINGCRGDNRIQNLRQASPTLNSQNQRRARSDNKSCGILGVTWESARNKWKAQIKVDGRKVMVGRFDDPHEAGAAYVAAKRRCHAGCTL